MTTEEKFAEEFSKLSDEEKQNILYIFKGVSSESVMLPLIMATMLQKPQDQESKDRKTPHCIAVDCPKCDGKMVPLSKIDGWVDDHGGRTFVPFYEWKCIKCGHYVGAL